jgi:phenylalanyl-tRNA synthetase alpha chain
LNSPKIGRLPENKIVNAVKSAHENGGKTGSSGWGYSWNRDIAAQLMPRAHTTSVSARKMAKDFKVPGKYFTIGRVFRPDVLDATHLIEFNQLEFMVVDENLNMANLMGVLKKFAEEFAGATKFRFLPDYYPFTEPSVQIDGYSPELRKWVEFGGAGIFRPEITESLGISAPVLAGAFGIDRLFQKKIASKDIRELFSDDLAWLKRKEVIL